VTFLIIRKKVTYRTSIGSYHRVRRQKETSSYATKNGAIEMTKELAISLLNRKDVYLTLEGKKMLDVILKEKNAYEEK
ncbi:hypothetical protein V7Y60_25370, partial [Priestia megaterium]|uniref:hypothetical protein n=1 Tax=Priestia megaterium TaxID=1404 RepID=UPI002FFD8544